MATQIYDPLKHKQQQAQAGVQPTTGTFTPGGTGTGPSAATNYAQKKPQGSGRFTNIKQYLGANVGAQKQLTGRVGSNINKAIQQKQEQAAEYGKKLGEAVTKSKESLGAGKQYLGQLKQIGQSFEGGQGPAGITALSQDPKFSQYQQIAEGGGVSEDALKKLAGGYYGGAQSYAKGAQQAAKQIGTESGRFELLRKALGGDVNPQYSLGQQRLDQLFLSGDPLRELQQETAMKAKAARQLASEADVSGRQATDLARAEQSLMEGIDEQASENIGLYGDYMQDLVSGAQEKQLEGQRLRDALASGEALTKEQFAELGMDPGQLSLGVDLSKYVDLDLAPVTEARLMDADRLAQYQALEKMAGIKDGKYEDMSGVDLYEDPEVRKQAMQDAIQQKSAELQTAYKTYGQDPFSGLLSGQLHGDVEHYITGAGSKPGQWGYDHYKELRDTALAARSLKEKGFDPAMVKQLVDSFESGLGAGKYGALDTAEEQAQYKAYQQLKDFLKQGKYDFDPLKMQADSQEGGGFFSVE